VRFVPSAHFRTMPWKNGLGTTREVAVGGDPAAFDWRISIATVGASGPFSAFPGIDRTIAILQGQGMVLDVDGTRHDLRAGGAPFSFAGEAKVHAECIAGETIDLNAMTRRGAFTHVMERLASADPFTFTGPPGLTVLVCNGAFELEMDGNVHHALPLNAVIGIGEGQSMAVRPQGNGELVRITIAALAR
jgi:environmental stress-induced protein Ves